jgi:hypothetical protein
VAGGADAGAARQVTKVRLAQKQREGIAEARSGRRSPVRASRRAAAPLPRTCPAVIIALPHAPRRSSAAHDTCHAEAPCTLGLPTKQARKGGASAYTLLCPPTHTGVCRSLSGCVPERHCRRGTRARAPTAQARAARAACGARGWRGRFARRPPWRPAMPRCGASASWPALSASCRTPCQARSARRAAPPAGQPAPRARQRPSGVISQVCIACLPCARGTRECAYLNTHRCLCLVLCLQTGGRNPWPQGPSPHRWPNRGHACVLVERTGSLEPFPEGGRGRGQAYGRTTYLATTLERVPRGTEGAVSAEGTAAGLAAAVAFSSVAAALGQARPAAQRPVLHAHACAWRQVHVLGLRALEGRQPARPPQPPYSAACRAGPAQHASCRGVCAAGLHRSTCMCLESTAAPACVWPLLRWQTRAVEPACAS